MWGGCGCDEVLFFVSQANGAVACMYSHVLVIKCLVSGPCFECKVRYDPQVGSVEA